jgi:hypothetical protein
MGAVFRYTTLYCLVALNKEQGRYMVTWAWAFTWMGRLRNPEVCDSAQWLRKGGRPKQTGDKECGIRGYGILREYRQAGGESHWSIAVGRAVSCVFFILFGSAVPSKLRQATSKQAHPRFRLVVIFEGEGRQLSLNA